MTLIISISLTGSAIIGFICIQQLDIKVVIAYSSVAHIGLVIRSILYLTQYSVIGRMLLIVAHGLRSSAIFFGGNLLYLRSFSRRVVIRKGILGLSPFISFL
jgi:NADH:ubiquinone oxidoreductase subunit 4 (subunit M)